MYPMVGGPHVIFADDDGMDLDANVVAVPEADKDEDGEGVIDADIDEDV